jgi:hypothetical protein
MVLWDAVSLDVVSRMVRRKITHMVIGYGSQIPPGRVQLMKLNLAVVEKEDMHGGLHRPPLM